MRSFRIMDEDRIRVLEKRPFANTSPHAIELIREGKCPMCEKVITGFKDETSERDYRVSGMCQDCQDAVFGRKGFLEYF